VRAFEAYGWREVMAVPINAALGYEGLATLATLKDAAAYRPAT
jgi:hypothetical protein